MAPRAIILRVGLLAALLTGSALAAAAPLAPVEQGPGVYLEISPNGTADLLALLDDLEQSLIEDEPINQPVVVVLHGPEALPFIRRNYPQNQTLVDRAAKLQAFGRLELRMCETWMRRHGYDGTDLLPFVEPVPLAPEEVARLRREGRQPYRSPQL
jgi:uncharacterized protein